jgi:hypothetical protein
MSDGMKNFLKLIGVIIALFIVYRLLVLVVHLAISVAIPVLVIGGIGYAIYRYNGGRALMGGKKTLP